MLEGFTIVNGYGLNGGAVLCTTGSAPTIVDCAFRGSTATFGGGAVCAQGAAPTLAGCFFGANTAGAGGTLWIRGGSLDLVSCTLYGNVARYRGAGIFVRDGVSLDIANSIIAYQGIGGAVWCEGNASSVSAACSDVYGNVGGDWTGCLAGLGSSAGNFSSDPRFCLSPGFELYLQQGSPCLRGTGCGMVGAYNEGCLARYVSQRDQLRRLSGSLPEDLAGTEGVPVSWGVLKAQLRR